MGEGDVWGRRVLGLKKMFWVIVGKSQKKCIFFFCYLSLMHILYKYHNSLRDSILPPPITNCSIVSYNSYSHTVCFITLLNAVLCRVGGVFFFVWRRLFYSAFTHFFVGAKTGKIIQNANKESGTLIGLGGLRQRWPSAVSSFNFQVSGGEPNSARFTKATKIN